MTKSMLTGTGAKATVKSIDEAIAWSRSAAITKRIDGKIFGWIGTIYHEHHKPADVTALLNKIRGLGYYVREYIVPRHGTSAIYARKKR